MHRVQYQQESRELLARRHVVDQSAAIQDFSPKFREYEFRNECDSSREITKDEALCTIRDIPPDRQLPIDGRGGLSDVKSWIGKDRDVDIAIVEKFPWLMTDEQRDRAQRARLERSDAQDERGEAVLLMREADAVDRLAERQHQVAAGGEAGEDTQYDGVAARHERAADELRSEAGFAYDSAERREAMAKGLDHVENRAAVQARVRSDVAQGRPATDAVTKAARRAPKARKNKGSPQVAWKTQRLGQGR